MEMSPQTIRTTGFRTVKKGYDPAEVDAFREEVAGVVELSQNQATAMEARARAAVAKLQEVSQQGGGRDDRASMPSGDTEVISRTLLLAQRTADATVAEAKDEADGILTQAREEAGRVLDNARTMATKTLDEARSDARRAADDERVLAENEVQALLARRDFLLADVDHLEEYLQAQRERLRDAAVQLHELVERVPGGLGEMRRPLLSASADALPGSDDGVAAEQIADEPPEAGDDTVAIDYARSDDDTGEAVELPDTTDGMWRMLDEEVGGQASFDDLATNVTAEVPAVPSARNDDRFRSGSDDTQ
jgi:DivIVA domain-containing protein